MRPLAPFRDLCGYLHMRNSEVGDGFSQGVSHLSSTKYLCSKRTCGSVSKRAYIRTYTHLLGGAELYRKHVETCPHSEMFGRLTAASMSDQSASF